MSEVLRANLLAAKASALALAATIDAALSAPEAATAPTCAAHGCAHERTETIRGMGSTPMSALCLNCGCTVEGRADG